MNNKLEICFWNTCVEKKAKIRIEKTVITQVHKRVIFFVEFPVSKKFLSKEVINPKLHTPTTKIPYMLAKEIKPKSDKLKYLVKIGRVNKGNPLDSKKGTWYHIISFTPFEIFIYLLVINLRIISII